MSDRTTVLVSGMTCAACVSRVEQALQRVDGVEDAFVNLATGQAVVRHGDGLDPDRLGEAVRGAGYGFEGLEDASSPDRIEQQRSAHERSVRLRTVVSALFTVPVLVGSYPHMVGTEPNVLGNLWVLLVLAAPIQFWAAWPFLRGAVGAVRHRSPDMNVLVALGTLSAYGYSALAAAVPGFFEAVGAMPASYVDAVAVIVTFILAGRWLELRARGRASDAIKALMELRPATATIMRDGGEREIPASEVVVGDLVVIRPGERVAVDGVVVEGSSATDESMLTGESIPQDKSPGDEVVGGTVNAMGRLVVRATRVGADTALQQIVRLVREAQGSRAPVQRVADRVVSVFVPVVLVVAALSFALWLAFGPAPAFNHALVSAVAVLIVACPCAMGLATPIAIMVGTGTGARSGVLIRGGEALERARHVTTVVLDKTGTLTTGRLEVEAVVPIGRPDDEVLRLAAAAEEGSEHPIGRSIVRAARGRGLTWGPVDGFRAHAGHGVEALVEGSRLRVGTPGFAGDGTTDLEAALEDLYGKGLTTVVVGMDGSVAGLVGVGDAPKDGAGQAVADLRRMELDVVMLSGDHERVARAVAEDLGIERVFARVLPDEKAARIRDLQSSGEVVAMVGDGVNDAPALAQADVGIAIGTGTDVAKEASDLTLVSGDVRGVPRALRLARRTYRTILQNLFWAFVYNVTLIPLAAGAFVPVLGWQLNPALAGLAMALSSVSVVANSLRLRRAAS